MQSHTHVESVCDGFEIVRIAREDGGVMKQRGHDHESIDDVGSPRKGTRAASPR